MNERLFEQANKIKQKAERINKYGFELTICSKQKPKDNPPSFHMRILFNHHPMEKNFTSDLNQIDKELDSILSYNLNHSPTKQD